MGVQGVDNHQMAGRFQRWSLAAEGLEVRNGGVALSIGPCETAFRGEQVDHRQVFCRSLEKGPMRCQDMSPRISRKPALVAQVGPALDREPERQLARPKCGLKFLRDVLGPLLDFNFDRPGW